MAEGDDNKYYVNYSNARPWSLDEPNLYSIRAELLDASGAVTDEKTVRFGFRTAEFRRSGFYLNGERVFLRGLNRHQCYPYMGYAAPESAPARGRADIEGRALLHGGAHVALSAEPALYRCVRRAGSARVHRASRLAAHRRRGVEAPVGGERARDGDAVPQSSVHRPLGRSHQRKSG